jgi:hypothetical protein
MLGQARDLSQIRKTAEDVIGVHIMPIGNHSDNAKEE